MFRQHLAESCHSHRPVTRTAGKLLQFLSDSQLTDRAPPALPACTALVTEPAQIVSAVRPYITKSWDIESTGSSAIVVAVFKSIDGSAGPHLRSEERRVGKECRS